MIHNKVSAYCINDENVGVIPSTVRVCERVICLSGLSKAELFSPGNCGSAKINVALDTSK